MSQGKKRKLLLDQYASQYVRPSKYLLIYRNDEEDSSQENKQAIPKENSNLVGNSEENSSSSALEIFNNNGKSIKDIGNDCFFEVLTFLELNDFRSCILVSKTWARLIIPFFMDLSMEIYENELHLDSLMQFVYENDTLELRDGLYTEQATWKAFACYVNAGYEYSEWNNELVCLDYDEVIESKEQDDDNEYERQRQLIPFGIPLCKGTIKDQFELVQDRIDPEMYSILVEDRLAIPREEQETYEVNPFLVSEEIEREKGMMESYIHEIQESKYRDNDEDNFNVDSEDHTPYAIRAGIIRFASRAGILMHEPSVIEDAFYQLKKYIYLTIKDAYENKFPNKTEELKFKESYEDYCLELENDFKVKEQDEDLKLNSWDIVNSVKNLTGKSLMLTDLFESLTETPTGEQGDIQETNEIDNEDEISETSTENSSDELDIVSLSEGEETAEEDELKEEIIEEDDLKEETNDMEEDELKEETSLEEVETDDNFIDDSYNFDLDVENLGETLPEQLMKVSIHVHEQVFGKERAHREKLYLQNWYGNGDLFFVNCSKELENPNTYEFEFCEFCKDNQIYFDKCADVEYFGYSLYESDMNEFPIVDHDDSSSNDENEPQATQEESLQYHLRRMLREQSYECIVKHFELSSK